MADSKLVVMLKLDGTDLGKGISRAQADIAKIGTAFTGAGLAAGAAVKFAANYQDETIKAARAAGTTAAEFSRMAYAAELSGVSAGDLSKGLAKLSKPSTEAYSALRQMGIAATDSSGRLKNQDLLLSDVADGMSKLTDPTSKARAATMLFGEEGAKMVSMLEGGAKSLKMAAKEAEAFGQVVSQEAGQQAEKFNDNLAKVSKGVTGFRNVVSESIIEMVNQSGAMESVQDVIKDSISWWRSLSKETQQTIIKIGAGTVAFGGLLLVLSAVAAAAPAIAAGFALMTGPVGLVILAVTGLAAAFYALEKSQIVALTNADALLKKYDEQNKVIDDAGSRYRELEGTSSKLQSRNADVRRSVAELETITSKYNISLTDQNGNYRKLADVLGEVNKERLKESQNALAGLGILEAQTRAEVRALEITLAQLPAIAKYTTQYSIANALLQKRKQQLDEIVNSEKKHALAIQEANQAVAKTPGRKEQKEVKPPPPPPELLYKSEILSAISEADKARELSKNNYRLTAEQQRKLAEDAMNAQIKATSETAQLGIAYAKVTEKIANLASSIVKPFSDLTDTIAKGIEYDSQVALRDLDVVSQRAAETYAAQKEAMEAEETAKIKALEDSYDKQIAAVKAGEDAKTQAAQFAADQRLLAADEEYRKQLDALNAAFAAQMEADRVNYEMKMAELDLRAIDREQRQLTETIMEEDARLLKEQRESAHEKTLADLAKNYADKKKGIDDDLKGTEKANSEKNKAEIEALTNAKNLALEAAEAEKNAKLKKLDEDRAAQEKALEKQRLETQYKAQMDAFNATKGIKIAETAASGAAAAAQAFVSMTAANPWGLGEILGGIVAATIMGVTTLRISQINSQQPIKPAGLLEDGGFIGGSGRHMNGTDYAARVESGELYIDRGRSAKMLRAIDNGIAGGGGIQITFQAGAIQGDIRDERTMNMLAVRLGNLIQRQMVTA